jgi:hypothetical protein
MYGAGSSRNGSVLNRSAAILETDVAAHTAPFGHFNHFGTHGQPPQGYVQFIGAPLLVQRWAKHTVVFASGANASRCHPAEANRHRQREIRSKIKCLIIAYEPAWDPWR